jgi:hypothetical protein
MPSSSRRSSALIVVAALVARDCWTPNPRFWGGYHVSGLAALPRATELGLTALLLQRTRDLSSTWGRCRGKMAESGSNLTKETKNMSIQSHLAELERRHRALEDEITDALAHPSTDDLTIAELKRRKLQVKDEIARLKHAASQTVH